MAVLLNAQGNLSIFDPDGKTIEFDTLACAHCGGIIFAKPGSAGTVYLFSTLTPGVFREEPGAACSHCRTPRGAYRPVCLKDDCLARCRPLEQMLDEIEGRRRRAGVRLVL
jgi:hypothetical protein